MTRRTQTAITRHPERHGSYRLRVKFTDGATMEVLSRPLPLAELIEAMEEQLATLKRIDGVTPEGASER